MNKTKNQIELRVAGIILFCLCCLASGFVSAVEGAQTAGGRDVPQALVMMPQNSYAILVEKSTQKLFLFASGPEGIQEVMAFPCSTGEAYGRKLKAGDRKTPEGVYFFIDEYEDRYLSPVYGKKAFPTDYPNFIDKRAGRNGSAIWLHGTNKTLKPMDSNGCVAMKNQDILTLAKYIKLNATPIIMTETLEYTDQQTIAKEKETLMGLLDGWGLAIESGDYHDYLAYYDPSYLPEMAWWPSWSRIRDSIAKDGESIDFVMDLEGVYKERELAVIIMREAMRLSNETISLGKRHLFLQKTGNHYTIIGDVFDSIPEAFAGEPHLLPAAAEVLAQKVKQSTSLTAMIESWLRAWSAKDMKTYGGYYSEDFYSDDMTKDQWLARKKRLASAYNYIQVTGSNFVVDEGKDTSVVKFIQDYRSSKFSAVGEKTLVLKKQRGSWKIYRETWKMR